MTMPRNLNRALLLTALLLGPGMALPAASAGPVRDLIDLADTAAAQGALQRAIEVADQGSEVVLDQADRTDALADRVARRLDTAYCLPEEPLCCDVPRLPECWRAERIVHEAKTFETLLQSYVDATIAEARRLFDAVRALLPG